MRYKKDDVAKAILEANGMVTHAAKKLGCSRLTVYNYINKYEECREALDDARESLGDRIETTLLSEALGNKDKEPNIAALIFLAKTHPAMRNRGYAEKQIQEHEGMVNVQWSQVMTITEDDNDPFK